MRTQLKRATQHGNVLFLILIAVALFAALSYAVTKSSSSGGGDISTEQASLDQAVLENCDSNIELAALRLELIHNCDTSEINYETASGLFSNESAPSDGSCNIFKPGPGDASPCGVYLNATVVNTDSELDSDAAWNESAQGTGWVVSGGKITGTAITGQVLTQASFTLDTTKTYRTEVKVNSMSGADLNVAFFNPNIEAHRLVPTITAAGLYTNNSYTPPTATEFIRITPASDGGNYEIEFVRIIDTSGN